MERHLSARELDEWVAFYLLEAEDAKPPTEQTPRSPEHALLQQQVRMMLADAETKRKRRR